MLDYPKNLIKNVIKQILLHYRVWIYYCTFVIFVWVLYYCVNLLNVKNTNKTTNFFTLFDSKIVNEEITIIILVNDVKRISVDYSISIPTVHCYAQANNYNLLIIDYSNKTSFPSKCNIQCVS